MSNSPTTLPGSKPQTAPRAHHRARGTQPRHRRERPPLEPLARPPDAGASRRETETEQQPPDRVGGGRLTCGQHPSQTPFPQASPKREDLTRDDLGFYHPRYFFTPVCPDLPGRAGSPGRTVRHTSHGNRPLSGSPPRSPLSVKTEGRRHPTKVPVRTVPVRARRPLGCGEDAPPRRGRGSSACRSRAGSSCTATAAASCRCDTSAACACSSRRQPTADVFSRLATSAIRSG
jgi:hypothetical protein